MTDIGSRRDALFGSLTADQLWRAVREAADPSALGEEVGWSEHDVEDARELLQDAGIRADIIFRASSALEVGRVFSMDARVASTPGSAAHGGAAFASSPAMAVRFPLHVNAYPSKVAILDAPPADLRGEVFCDVRGFAGDRSLSAYLVDTGKEIQVVARSSSTVWGPGGSDRDAVTTNVWWKAGLVSRNSATIAVAAHGRPPHESALGGGRRNHTSSEDMGAILDAVRELVNLEREPQK